MSTFKPLLKRIYHQLDLPQPSRSRIILEIQADLEDLYQVYREQGITESEAAKLAEEKLGLNDDTLQEIIQIHETPLRRWLDRLSGQTQATWEKTVMVIVLIAVGAISSNIFINTRFFLNTSPFILPVIGIGFYVLARALEKVYTLYIKKDHHVDRLRQGMPTLLFMGGANLLIGVSGYFLESFYRGGDAMLMEGHLFFLLPTGAPGYQQRLHQITDWLMRGSSLMMFCLMITLSTAVVWFILENKIKQIEIAEAAIILEE